MVNGSLIMTARVYQMTILEKECPHDLSRGRSPDSETAAVEEAAVSGYPNPIDLAIMCDGRV
jgi:hypothetical protein